MAEIEKYSYKIVKKIRIRIPDVPGALGIIATELGKNGVVLGGRPRIQSLANNLFGNKYQISSNHFMKSHCPQQKSPSGY